MHATRLIARLGLLAVGFGASLQFTAAASRAAEPSNAIVREENAWPVWVRPAPDVAHPAGWTAAGPLLFSRAAADGTTWSGLRPLWVQQDDAAGRFRAGFFLYPVFSYRVYDDAYQWNILELVRQTIPRSTGSAPASRFAGAHDFEIWPFVFSRETGDPELSYHALFPLGGTIKNKLGFDRATWVLFPLYTQTVKRDVRTTSVPWPFVRITSGKAHGFGLWPLFEVREMPGVWKQQTYLWPLGYNNTTYPAADAPAGTPPKRQIGALPFYARHTGPGYHDENFLWPFFGYTDSTAPAKSNSLLPESGPPKLVHYHETRYFWPLLVQGRGDGRYVNRWGPVYTHSNVNGYDKRWYVWPVVRHAEWSDRGLAISRTQFLYFLYWSERERSETNPAKPSASLTHVWPLYSAWDNGAGQKQFQLFSPLEVFFPGNEKIQAAWSPLFALARREQTAPGETRTSLLWNAVTWRRSEAAHEREFHLGPVLSVARSGDDRRVAIGNGLVSFRRDADSGWKVRWLDFPAKASSPSSR